MFFSTPSMMLIILFMSFSKSSPYWRLFIDIKFASWSAMASRYPGFLCFPLLGDLETFFSSLFALFLNFLDPVFDAFLICESSILDDASRSYFWLTFFMFPEYFSLFLNCLPFFTSILIYVEFSASLSVFFDSCCVQFGDWISILASLEGTGLR